MTAPNRTNLPARAVLWLAGAALCSGYYWLRTAPFPRRTPVGVERRLFGGVGQYVPVLEERPGGGAVAVTMTLDAPVPSATPPKQAGEWPGWLLEHARARLYSGPRGARPSLNPLPAEGTWFLERDRLRYRWRLDGRWLGTRYLASENLEGLLGPSGNWLLDLKTGRTYRGAAADARMPERADDGSSEYDPYAMTGMAPDPVSPALDGLDAEASSFDQSHLLEGREAALHWAGNSDCTADLIAATTREPFRSRLMSSRAELLLASRDGRTLFVRKADGVWRVDLRKPVTELLQEVTVPELPLEGVLPGAEVKR